MTAFKPNSQNPWRLMYCGNESIFKLIIFTMDFSVKYRVTIRIATNWNSKLDFSNHCTLHTMPAQIMARKAQYYVYI